MKEGKKDSHHTSVNIRDDILEEVDELVKINPKGYRYETRAGFITDAINLHIRRIRKTIDSGFIPEEYFDVYKKH